MEHLDPSVSRAATLPFQETTTDGPIRVRRSAAAAVPFRPRAASLNSAVPSYRSHHILGFPWYPVCRCPRPLGLHASPSIPISHPTPIPVEYKSPSHLKSHHYDRLKRSPLHARYHHSRRLGSDRPIDRSGCGGAMASSNPAAADAKLQKPEAVAVAGVGGEGPSFGAVGAEQAPRRPAAARKERVCTAKERISRMPPCAAGKRSSIYRGVTRHRWTGRYEAHLWDKSTWNQNQNKKGKQVYLGAYDDEEAAARAYDLAALKYWGAGTQINFPVSDYARDLEEMKMIAKEDYLVSLRRKSSAFSRGLPKYRGLPRQLHNSRWDASLGQLLGNDYMSLSCGKDITLDGKFAGSFGLERKIDLTNYIRWWLPKKTRQSDTSKAEEVADEIRAIESSMQRTEPYKLPSLALCSHAKPSSVGLSACSILSQSDAFKSFLEKSTKLSEGCTFSKEMDEGKVVASVPATGHDTSAVNINMNELLVQRAPYTLAPVMPTPMKSTWNPSDPSVDPLFWSNFILPSSQPVTMATITTTFAKNEASSSDPFQSQE